MTAWEVAVVDAAGIETRLSLAEAATMALEDAPPVRRFASWRGQRNMPGWYWCATNGRHVGYESRLEASWLTLADYDQEIVGVSSQPFGLRGRLGNKDWRHVPDYFARLASGRGLVVDVKPARDVSSPDNQAVFSRTDEACREAGWDYQVASEPDPQVWANVSWLAGYRRLLADPGGYGPAAVGVCDQPRRFDELVASLGPPALVAPAVFHLCWIHDLEVDVTQSLRGWSMVRPGKGRA